MRQKTGDMLFIIDLINDLITYLHTRYIYFNFGYIGLGLTMIVNVYLYFVKSNQFKE